MPPAAAVNQPSKTKPKKCGAAGSVIVEPSVPVIAATAEPPSELKLTVSVVGVVAGGVEGEEGEEGAVGAEGDDDVKVTLSTVVLFTVTSCVELSEPYVEDTVPAQVGSTRTVYSPTGRPLKS